MATKMRNENWAGMWQVCLLTPDENQVACDNHNAIVGKRSHVSQFCENGGSVLLNLASFFGSTAGGSHNLFTFHLILVKTIFTVCFSLL